MPEQADTPAALNTLGMQALGRGDPAARDYFTRAVALDPKAPALWRNLASAERAAGNDPGERAALDGALAVDRLDLMANVRLAELLDRQGAPMAAATYWDGVVAVASAMPQRTPQLEALIADAQARVKGARAGFAAAIDGDLASVRAATPGRDRRRFDACMDAMLGRRRIYHNECHGLHFPFLPADEFFDRGHFAWMDELEAATPAIRRELEGLLAGPDSGFAPYVDMPAGTPANKWTALDRSDAWRARYLWRYGAAQDEVQEACPETAAVLGRMPLAAIPGRGPTAFFSILRAGARLPAHSGVSNVRAIVHLPLIVPPGCAFRVGGETRPWVEGEAFAFDDTIEHEAWNEGSSLRAVLIFDVWNPHLTPVERDMLNAFYAAADASGHNPANAAMVD